MNTRLVQRSETHVQSMQIQHRDGRPRGNNTSAHSCSYAERSTPTVDLQRKRSEFSSRIEIKRLNEENRRLRKTIMRFLQNGAYSRNF